MFFNGSEPIYTSIIISVILYFSIVTLLRFSGKRTLSDLNAFDLLVTITMGSIAATTILSKDTSYVNGIISISTLIVLQYVIAKGAVFSKNFNKLIRSKSTLVFYKGEYLEENMKKMRITKNDILQQARLQQGITSNQISAALLESNGKLSIIKNSEQANEEELKNYM